MPKISLSIKSKLIAMVGVLLLPVMAVSVWHYFEILEKETADMAVHNQNVVINVASKLDTLIGESLGIIHALSRHPAVVSHDSAQLDRLFAELLPSYAYRLNIVLADMAGAHVSNGASLLRSDKVNYLDREWFVSAREGRDVVCNFHVSKLLGKPAVMVAGPVFDGGARQVGVLGISLDLNALNNAMATTWRKPPGTYIMVVDRNGTILIDTRKPEQIGSSARPVLPDVIFPSLHSESRKYTDGSGVEWTLSTAPVGNHGWTVVTTIPLAGAKRLAQSVSRNSLLVALGAGLLAVLLALVIGRTITRGIAELLTGMKEIERGNLDCTLRLSGNAELESVAASFNSMSERLKKSETDLQTLNAELEQRVAQRTAQLELANRELESFSYSVSHDLGAPLRHMAGFSRVLLEDYGDRLDDDARGFLTRIERASKRMSDMINAMLNLSRLTRGELCREAVDLGDMAREIVGELKSFQPERQVVFSIAKCTGVHADIRLMRVVMENLLGNAWKYTRGRENTEITFDTVQREGKMVYFVRDNGVGFDMRYVQRLFTPFQRMHLAGEFEGDGIGLATVQRIIHRHGGSIWAEAEEGAGATFFFTLD